MKSKVLLLFKILFQQLPGGSMKKFPAGLQTEFESTTSRIWSRSVSHLTRTFGGLMCRIKIKQTTKQEAF